MRIVYGVHGYGLGHATRALGVLPELKQRHEVLVLAGGDAYQALAPLGPVTQIPTLTYVYRKSGRVATPETLHENAERIWDLISHGDTHRRVLRALRDFQPDLAICDVEPWTHQVAARLGIPRISFDHFGILAYCKPPMPWPDRIRCFRDIAIYRALTGRPERVIVSSFYDAPTLFPSARCVGALLRDDVFKSKAARGDYLLAYFNKGDHQYTPHVEEALQQAGLPVLVYGTSRAGTDGRVTYRRPGNITFLEDLARCRAVLSTAGNQLVGEALYFRKPILVHPERSVEQRLNAAAVARLGFGEETRHESISARTIQQFLRNAPAYEGAASGLVRDGRADALSAIESFAAELSQPHHRAKRSRSWELAW
jgi:uncharacterized protein (TIGR00661 family)